MSELIREALHRYVETDRLMSAIASGDGRSEALEDFLDSHVVRIVHEARTDGLAEKIGNKSGERIVS